MYDVITLGSATVDVFADTASQMVKFITAEGERDLIAYPSGTKILISDLQFLIGGGGTNTAVSFARLGLVTAFAGKIGTDENGYKVKHLLAEENIEHIGPAEGQTGYSIILDSIEHDRTILTFKGANNMLREDELPEAQARWCYLSSMMEQSFRSAVAFATRLHAQGTRIAFNPSSYQAKLGLLELKSLLDITDALILNKEEAALLLGKQGDAEHLATILAEHHPQYVLITDGANGVTCFHAGTIYHVGASPDLTVVESTGAGDAFASGFVAGLHKGLEVIDALKLGMVQAESVIRAPGAKKNLLHWHDADTARHNFSGAINQWTAPAIMHSEELLSGLPGKSRRAPENEAFLFANGKELTTLEELAYYLKFVSTETFLKHVHEKTHDYASWIEHSLDLPDLARQIRPLTDQYVMSKTILEYIHKVNQ